MISAEELHGLGDLNHALKEMQVRWKKVCTVKGQAERITNMRHDSQKETTEMGCLYPGPQGAVVKGVTLCTILSHQKMTTEGKRKTSFVNISRSSMNCFSLHPSFKFLHRRFELHCRERATVADASALPLEQFTEIDRAHTMSQTDAHDWKNSCLSCVHKLEWKT